MKFVIWFLIAGIICPIIYGITVFWAFQVIGSLFYTFPKVLLAYTRKEITSAKPIFIAFSPVILWLSIVFIFNLLFYIFWTPAFVYFYTNVVVLIVIGLAILQCFFHLGNTEMTNYTNNLIEKFKE